MSRPALRPRALLAAPAALALTLTPALAACSAGHPLSVPGPEVSGGAIGPDEAVTGDLSVLQVQLEYPLDGAHERRRRHAHPPATLRAVDDDPHGVLLRRRRGGRQHL